MMDKLRILPDPDWLLRLIPVNQQVRMFEFMVRRIFNAETMQCFQPIYGKSFLFCTPGDELGLVMSINEGGAQVVRFSGIDQAIDVTIRGDLAALAALCLGLEDTDSLFFSRRLLLTGDTSTGLLFKNVLANLDFDLRFEMEKNFGKRLGGLFWKMAAQGINAVEVVDHRLVGITEHLGSRFGLFSAGEMHVLEREVRQLKEENLVLKRQVKRRPARRPAPV